MDSNPGPTVKKLEDLLKEAHNNNNVPQATIGNLKSFIKILEKWNSDADRLLGIKHDNSKQHKTRNERCQNLMERAVDIGFDLVQLPQVEAYAEKLEDLDAQITPELLSSNNSKLQTDFFRRGLQLRADSVNFKLLRKAIQYNSWQDLVHEAFRHRFVEKTYKNLIKDGHAMAMNTDNDPLFRRLVAKEEFGNRVVQYLENVIKGKEKIGMNDQQSIFNLGHNTDNSDLSIELDTHIISRLRNSLSRSKSTLTELDILLNTRCTNTNIADRPSISEAQKLTAATRELCFGSDLAASLTFEMSRNSQWNEQLRSTLMHGKKQALDVVLKGIMANVQRITQSEGKPDLFCICRKPESGLMIECQVCHERYHVSCMKVARSTTAYECSVCHPAGMSKKIPRISRQPTLTEITNLLKFGETLSFRPKDYDVISSIHKTMQDYKSHVQAFCLSKEHLQLQDVKRMKYYLRTLMGLEVLLLDETEFLRSKIQLLAIPPTSGSSSVYSVDQNHEKPSNQKMPIVEHKKTNINNESIENCANLFKAMKPVDTPQQQQPEPMDVDKPENRVAKRKLVTTVGQLPPSRPHKIIKLTVNPPKPTNINATSYLNSSSLSSSSALNPNKKKKAQA